jgi:glucosamine--fructose-6-phosphate aminotransferase (isomerizing)
MCGIVGAVAGRDIVPVLMEGLRRLEYRGYDSAGIAVLNGSKHLTRLRTVGKVRMLDDALAQTPTAGKIGIAHTRWATHGVPSERNAHPHISHDGLAIVHNGIIENHDELRADLERRGYKFSSETDTEVIAHRVHYHLGTLKDLFKAVRATVAELEGAYALAVVSEHDPERLILAREGCPVVIGLGDEENFVASDVAALLPVTRRFMFLEEGDVAEVRRKSVRILDRDGNSVERAVRESELSSDAAEKGQYAHYMLKEIHEQPRAIADTLSERVAGGRLLAAAFGPDANEIFRHARNVHIVACTPPRWRVTSSSRSARSPAPWTLRASTATAVPWCPRTRCSSPSRNPERLPTPWQRCGWRSSPATLPRLRSATCPRARWYASRIW